MTPAEVVAAAQAQVQEMIWRANEDRPGTDWSDWSTWEGRARYVAHLKGIRILAGTVGRSVLLIHTGPDRHVWSETGLLDGHEGTEDGRIDQILPYGWRLSW